MEFLTTLGRMLRKQFKRLLRLVLTVLLLVLASMLVGLAIGKIYQTWDDDEQRGAMAMEQDASDEGYSTPIYLDQGWKESDSLWFYNTTQGSGLLPYDFFIVLEHADSTELLRSPKSMDGFRYLPQKPTFFNPDGLPVGFVKDTYRGKDYVGYTCAACHTAQVNYKGQAIRIDGVPALADMVGFLVTLEKSLQALGKPGAKRERFIKRVLALGNGYNSEAEVAKDIDYWTNNISLYNTINHSHIDYGYGRLDAFGRIYNRVLQHVLSKQQVRERLVNAMSASGSPILTPAQADKVLADINETIIRDTEFTEIS